jgi:hypothetical protein
MILFNGGGTRLHGTFIHCIFLKIRYCVNHSCLIDIDQFKLKSKRVIVNNNLIYNLVNPAAPLSLSLVYFFDLRRNKQDSVIHLFFLYMNTERINVSYHLKESAFNLHVL